MQVMQQHAIFCNKLYYLFLKYLSRYVWHSSCLFIILLITLQLFIMNQWRLVWICDCGARYFYFVHVKFTFIPNRRHTVKTFLYLEFVGIFLHHGCIYSYFCSSNIFSKLWWFNLRKFNCILIHFLKKPVAKQ